MDRGGLRSDGLGDSWEMANFGNLSQGASGDSDGDGLTNLQEYQLGTNPNNVDSDGDGVSDLIEAQRGANSNNPGTIITVIKTGTGGGHDYERARWGQLWSGLFRDLRCGYFGYPYCCPRMGLDLYGMDGL